MAPSAASESKSPFRILRATSRDELVRQLRGAQAEGWALVGEIVRMGLETDERWYCQVVPAAETAGVTAEDGASREPRDGLRVLVVEDHVKTGEVLVRMLRNHGFAVDHALNGTEARAKIGAQKYDVLVSDIGLPDTDGWALLGDLRGTQPSLKAIAMSGFGQPDDLAKSKAVGFDSHLIKPAASEAVIGAIRAALA